MNFMLNYFFLQENAVVIESRDKADSIRIKEEEADMLSSEMLIPCNSTSAGLIDRLLEEGINTFGSNNEVEEDISPPK